ncbi:C40 family peptidase [Nocardia asteroides]|uniref:C40 family peptidase n=1 Tax=Nocardia asteroides TaxID=1824 RepID=UPI001E487277|nr:NlpC/P60 family protein [Nocardia asteroides]UGT63348.1 NlpC/P60 family protein [Nocardia asteroides]
MARALSGDVDGVLRSMLELYGAGSPDANRAAGPAFAVATTEPRVAGAGAGGYTQAEGMRSSIADAHSRRDGVVGSTVGESGNGTVHGRSRLTDQLADFRSRVQALAALGGARFSGPALLDAAHTTVTNAVRQVDADVAAARKQASQIMPPEVPLQKFTRAVPASRRRRNRSRSGYRSRSRSANRNGRTRDVPAMFRDDGTAGSAAVQAAFGQIGLDYVWGGGGASGPTGGGFDCSGLTQYAIAQASGGEVILPRTTYDQIYSGRQVPMDQVQPGDLVFPKDSFSSRGPEHVQLAVDRDTVVEAPTPGEKVKRTSMPDQAIIVRVLPAGGAGRADRDA